MNLIVHTSLIYVFKCQNKMVLISFSVWETNFRLHAFFIKYCICPIQDRKSTYNQVHKLLRLLRNIWKMLFEMLRKKAPILTVNLRNRPNEKYPCKVD